MMLHLYGIYDRKAEYFINVFPSQNDATALRSFDTLIHKSSNNIFSDYPEDFELRYVCSVTGTVAGSLSDRNLLEDDHVDLNGNVLVTEFIQRGYKKNDE